jgi:glycosyltransferase involved in cell wall biosynthesis
MDQITASVVIPAYNEEIELPKCLASLALQTCKGMEVIVVDNASTDKTRTAAEAFKNQLNLTILSEPRRGRGRARHTGCLAANGTVILSMDADVTVAPDWVETYIAYLQQHPSIAAVTGPMRFRDLPILSMTVVNAVLPRYVWLHNILSLGHHGLYGCNFAITKKMYDTVGGFNPHLDAYEDIELSARVAQHGHIAYLRHQTISTSGRRFSRSILRGCLQYVKTYTQQQILRKKNVTLSSVQDEQR